MDQIDLLSEVIGRVTQANLLTDKNMQLFNIRTLYRVKTIGQALKLKQIQGLSMEDYAFVPNSTD